MMVSNYFQTIASKVGYITNPIDLESKNVMGNDYQSNDIRNAVLATGAPDPSQFTTQDEYNNALRLWNQTTSTYNANSAIQDNKNAVNNYTGANAPADMQGVTMMNNKYQYSNGNPILQKGTTTVYDEQGQPLDIPTAVAQQMAYEQAVNGDRVNTRSKYLGGGPSSPDQVYSSSATRQDYLNTLKQDPNLQGSGAVNDYYNYMQKAGDISHQFDNPNQDTNLNYASENLDAQGNGQHALTPNQQISQQLQQLGQQPNYRQSMFKSNDQMQALGGMMNKIAQLAPTWSNLPIQETVVK